MLDAPQEPSKAKVAVYVRVSSASQKVASQRREIERYLAGHGITGARWFVDEGYSGKTLDRPAMKALQRSIFVGEIDTIIVYALDRLARDALEGITLIAGWLDKGIRLIVLTLQMDFSGDVGRMVASLLFHIAQMERNRIRERQAAGIAAAKAACARCSTKRSNVPLVDGTCPRCGGTESRSWGGRQRGESKVSHARVRQLAAKGLNNTEIARILGVSRWTIIRALNNQRKDG